MAVSATMVKQLRDKTGAGMMDAKKALIETDGDMEAAVDLLRVKGLAKADKKAGRTAAEGLVALAVDGGRGVAVEVNSETDFVARNADFQQMCRQIAETALKGDGDVEALRSAKLGDKTVSEVVTEKVATIGENMNVRRLERLQGGTIASYVHNAAAENMGRIGVLVAVEGDAAAAAAIGKQVAMHVAATSPASLDQNDLDASLVERERQVLSEQARASGKPEQVIEKMIEGRMKKFFQEVCLVEQAFVVNPDQTVGQAVAEAGCKVTGFVRLAVGEGIEKEDEDFAAEVAKIGG